jgi:uncharacterized protein with NRDE domain
MCLLVFAFKVHPRYRLIMAGNRDEFHDRPAEPCRWWSDPGGILAGRDLEAGGAWMGVNRTGRAAVVTNYREPARPTSGRRSRGELVVGALTTENDLDAWARRLDAAGADYGGFNLIVARNGSLHFLTNRGADRLDLEPGIHGLSNHRIDTPWPKVVTARRRLEGVIASDRVSPETLFELLSDRRPADDDELPDTGVPREWERLLSSAFIVDDRYGTRASTVLLVDAAGGAEMVERRFDREGQPIGDAWFTVPPPDRSAGP